ncbi:cell envelope integrity protein CreD [Enterobacteriaceae bacterium ESL0689]|nr:cell envelope integrity protein CreD [Enterobacteriaceae bacterium ESL0689]
MFKSPLFCKISLLLGCILLLVIPVMMVRGLIFERKDYHHDVIESLSEGSSGPQKLAGPFIVIPVTETSTHMEDKKEIQVQRRWLYYWLPDSLVIDGNQNTETRKLGIYTGQLWHNDLQIHARFDPAQLEALQKENVTLGKPFVSVSVSDARGIGHITPPEMNGTTLSVEPGSGLKGMSKGIHMPLPPVSSHTTALDLTFSLTLNGSGDFSVVPLGRNSELQMRGNWPHPGFLGNFLPQKRQVSASGFSASWQSNWFANNIVQYFSNNQDIDWYALPVFNISITTPADQYQLIDRASKYAILLISLTFIAFFLFEILTSYRLHPMQYLLVGLSLTMFYLTLLALSEHIGFTPAWITASLMGAAINGVYLQAVLKGWRNSLLFVCSLLMLDGVMWGLLRSQDNALLLGTAVLMVVLCALMFLTRNIDWYVLSRTKLAVNHSDDSTPHLPAGE